jgi:amino acid transporter
MSSHSEGGGETPHPHYHHEGTITSIDISDREDIEKLKASSIGLISVLFLCITGSAPLAVFMFNFPFVVGAGNEKYAPAAFFFATIVLTIFSVGYVQMARKLRAAGGMFTYVSHGLGRRLGMMSGFSLAAAYTLFGASLIGGFAAFAQSKVASATDSDPINWIWFALLGIVGISLLGYFDIPISAKILGVALIFELAIILIFTVGVFIQGGNDGVSIDPVLPWNAFKGVAFGLGIFIAFWSWVGFEAAPNYAEESKNPHRIIPLAVYVSCVFVGVLYTLAAWASVSSYGPGNEAFDALSAGTTTVFGGELAIDYLNFNVVPAEQLIGSFLGQGMEIFIITGAFACAAALNNAGLRYTYALGREGLLPKALGRTHKKHKTPHVAVLAQALIAAAIVLAFRFADRTALDVYYWIAVQGVIWIILVQALTSLAVWVYFRREGTPSERHWWKTTVAPWIGFLAQMLVLYLCYKYLSSLAAGDVLYVKELGQIGPWEIGRWSFEIDITWLGIIGVLVPVLALVYAFILRSTNPAKFETAGRFINEGEI